MFAMNKKIKLDIISDVVCPWCVIGYRHLDAAIRELNLQDKVEIEWQPFELNPNMAIEGEDLRAHMARKYGTSRKDSDRARTELTQRGELYGFNFDYFDGMKMVNTLNAHILLELAHDLGKQTALKMRLFSAYFTEHKDISDSDVLINEAKAVGIEPQQARIALADDHLRQRIKSRQLEWQKMGITAVPTVVFNRSSAVSGAQPQATFKQILLELVAENKTN
ncbi:DSBA-like thioredoxin domain protein [Photobacterium andalusiense]|uniref:DSBA-like thioredoxin domain protein n=2 Tax=Photobacterium andalusiense TaxID=2204296 RepID=A0A1Y6MC49_9GAMM|nr:DSBA-like thioredoxin domain protein [Photobacterium andalusiense]